VASPLARAIDAAPGETYRLIIWRHSLKTYKEQLPYWRDLALYIKNPQDQPRRIAECEANIARAQQMVDKLSGDLS